MKCGTRSLAVLGAFTLSAMGLVPASWAVDASQPGAFGAAQPGTTEASQVEAAQGESAQVAHSDAAQATQPAQPENSAQSGDPGRGLVDTPISDIQAVGAGDESAMVGAVVTTVGVVTTAYPAGESGLATTLDGFTIQTPGSGGAWDEGRTNSDALFVYVGKNDQVPAGGTCVRVSGTVGEFPATFATDNPSSLTQLEASAVKQVDGCQAVTPTPVTGVPAAEQAESYESMLLAPQGTWTITGNYQTKQYGTLLLTPGVEPLRAATDVVAPGQAARDYEAANAARVIALDDGTNTNLLRGAATGVPYAYLANGAQARVGYHVSFDEPVVFEPRHGSFVFQPTSMVAAHPDRSPVTIMGQRPTAPTVGGNIRVATFNVLNYFSDLGVDEAGCTGYPDRTGAFVTAKKCRVRGAYSHEAFANQQSKIVSAINALGADVVALEEVENPLATGARPSAARSASRARGPAPRRASVLGFSWPEREAWPCPSRGARSTDRRQRCFCKHTTGVALTPPRKENPCITDGRISHSLQWRRCPSRSYRAQLSHFRRKRPPQLSWTCTTSRIFTGIFSRCPVRASCVRQACPR